MISSLDVFFVSVAINTLNFKLCYSACARAEYEVNGECCPMCAPGIRVYKHCTEFTSTTCVPCSNSSYTSQPNGLLSCLPCTLCDPGKSLRVKTVCTRQSDAVCEPLEGFYCIDHRSGGCIQATEHSKCSPGEYIQQTGTADRDTVCSGCAEGTFSNGSLHTCQTHSQCEDQGLTVIKPGSNSSDAECGNKSSPALIAGVTAGLIVVALVVVAAAVTGVMFFRIKNKTVQNTARASWSAEKGGEELEVGEPPSPTTITPMLMKNR
ncbi:tumor necrosis factor receptor superfamily member 14-like isoform X2 [Astyanax mexicanus]|uniref:tumor necrosis factor receptor superfamily member 14-like isoform X2 n=1 Tax=Astyanax mexicanus TaxID=7994 RepID=UPI0020CB2678|nr:tumor necrosis factor receptor superfamily member 14-like isoform X2 [Astyanax mexicanus]